MLLIGLHEHCLCMDWGDRGVYFLDRTPRIVLLIIPIRCYDQHVDSLNMNVIPLHYQVESVFLN